MKLAVTGGTGFVGSHFIDGATAAGHEIRALARRPQPGRAGVEWMEGSLESSDSLHELVRDTDAVVHIAGVINAPNAAGFQAGNVAGTLTMLAAATAAGTQRFVHVSSLAAREPGLSLYGASKARAEELVRESGLNWAMVRPPAVYGPGDRETLELFKMAKLGLMLLPPPGRVSMIHVGDLAALLLKLATHDQPSRAMFEADDGRTQGWSHREMAAAIGAAVGRRNVALSVPGSVLRGAARLDRLFRRGRAKLTPDRAAYFNHPDWVASAEMRPPAGLWRAAIDTASGLADTARWYEREGWL
ncbi:NAD(P)H-binding protein [Sphingomonas sinipercae]|uniref:NAD(P)H-binding protein n=1 Tax=Sphingomonas sinipercae TaxID=2714944 RepID=A0A6G7ZKN1_9SPHN|nr:NAD-dependent epimerase/dehydratase family protein [Sphingomonas sinipercae]QIL01475.1 NAD(P)H-binding protein [Sphingomonas sinipercae]